MYADAFGLFVFGAFLTSGSLSKIDFFDRLENDLIDRSGRFFICVLFFHLCKELFVLLGRKI